MTQTQYTTLVTLLHRLDARIERVEERLAYEFPTPNDIRDQVDRELHSILSPGGSLKVFHDD